MTYHSSILHFFFNRLLPVVLLSFLLNFTEQFGQIRSWSDSADLAALESASSFTHSLLSESIQAWNFDKSIFEVEENEEESHNSHYFLNSFWSKNTATLESCPNYFTSDQVQLVYKRFIRFHFLKIDC